MRQLSIDLETFSSVDITRAGVHRYVESSDFEILLFGYAFDGDAAEVVDIARGESLPRTLVHALTDGTVIKKAYNAAFEWLCLSKFLGAALPLEQWRCTQLQGLYCGYPRGLEAIGKALKLPSDARKLATGKALIQYFCKPCKPSKTNGGRTRNLPHHDLDKWGLFKCYCKQDVGAEIAVAKMLEAFPVPENVESQWRLDLQINSRGVCVDRELVRGALTIHAEAEEALRQRFTELTGLPNPNSLPQLKKWIAPFVGGEPLVLCKNTVETLLQRENLPERVADVLGVRQELGKTSVGKYKALEDSVCLDGKLRGTLQFYGANRTGRWAGRIVQVQNLPRTGLANLNIARELVRERQGETAAVLYGATSHLLSQLIRTVFVASPGSRFLDADFSAIEARVIAWLAGESWRLDVFRSHGKIYEASASQMFGVDITRIAKGNPEYELRQKGKIAELALGYQGGAGALQTMGALSMGIKEGDLPDLVSRWRRANPRIVDLWHKTERAAIVAVQTKTTVGVQGLIFACEASEKLDFLTVVLPSGRKLYYPEPKIVPNRWDRPSLVYAGQQQNTKQWGVVETYGGKLVENIVQAIARDVLAVALERLEAAGFPIVFHVHDEVVIDYPDATEGDLKRVTEIMATPVPWAPDLPLAADGWVDDYFRKD